MRPRESRVTTRNPFSAAAAAVEPFLFPLVRPSPLSRRFVCEGGKPTCRAGGRRPRFWKEEKSGKKSHGGRLPKSDNPSPVPSFLPSAPLSFIFAFLQNLRLLLLPSTKLTVGRASERRTSPVVPHCSEGWTVERRRSGAKTRICLFCGAPISSTHSAKKQGAARKTANNERTDSEGQLTLEPCCRPCPSVRSRAVSHIYAPRHGG